MDNLSKLHEEYRSLNHPDSGYFECSCPILAETEKAICFDIDKTWMGNRPNGKWISKSQIKVIRFSVETDQVDDRYFIKNWLHDQIYGK